MAANAVEAKGAGRKAAETIEARKGARQRVGGRGTRRIGRSEGVVPGGVAAVLLSVRRTAGLHCE